VTTDYNDPRMYDECFYPSPLRVLLKILSIVLVFIIASLMAWLFLGDKIPFMYKFISEIKNITSFPLGILVLFLIVFAVFNIFIVVLLSIFSIFNSLINLRKISVGINKDGLFIKNIGLISWKDIKSFHITLGPEKSILVTTSLAGPKFSPPSPLKAIWQVVMDKKRIVDEGVFKISAMDIKIPLKNLLGILNTYHKEYKGQK